MDPDRWRGRSARWVVGPRRVRSAVGAALLALAALASTLALPAGLARAQRPRVDECPCLADAHPSVSPTVLLAGEAVTATLPITAMCAAEAAVARVVIVLDGSSSMTDSDLDRAIAGAEALVDWLDLERRSVIPVGVVGFWDTGSYRCAPDSDPSRARGCIRRIRSPAGGQMVTDLGLRTAYNMLSAADAYRWLPLTVVFSNAGAPTDCSAAERAGGRLRGLGGRFLAACAGPGCDSACLRRVAGRGQSFVPAELLPRAWLGRLSDNDLDQILVVKPDRLTITGTLPAGVDLLPGRVFPPPRSVSRDGRTLEWQFDRLYFAASPRLTITLGLRLTQPGYQPAGPHAFGTLVDTLRRSRQYAFDDAWALVLGKP